jgi:hypothetical protein
MGRATTGTLHQTLRSRRHARASRLPDVDRLKEEVAYLKLWQGVAVVSFASLIGWLVSSGPTASAWTTALAVAGVASLGIGVVVIGRQIQTRIDRIGKV